MNRDEIVQRLIELDAIHPIPVTSNNSSNYQGLGSFLFLFYRQDSSTLKIDKTAYCYLFSDNSFSIVSPTVRTFRVTHFLHVIWKIMSEELAHSTRFAIDDRISVNEHNDIQSSFAIYRLTSEKK